MSQPTLAIVRFVSFVGGGVDMGDLEYIQSKVISGDYSQASGDISTAGSTIEITPDAGKTAFLIEAKIVISTHADPPAMGSVTFNTIVNDRVKAVLKIDSTVKDTTNIGVVMNATGDNTSATAASGASGQGQIGDGRFNVLGLSLVGDGAKKIEIENTLDAGSAFATMSVYTIVT